MKITFYLRTWHLLILSHLAALSAGALAVRLSLGV